MERRFLRQFVTTKVRFGPFRCTTAENVDAVKCWEMHGCARSAHCLRTRFPPPLSIGRCMGIHIQLQAALTADIVSPRDARVISQERGSLIDGACLREHQGAGLFS